MNFDSIDKLAELLETLNSKQVEELMTLIEDESTAQILEELEYIQIRKEEEE